MNADRHYDDETLIALIETGDDETLRRDPHLVKCGTCAEVADQLRMIAGAMGERDVWDPRELDETPDAGTIALLRGYADEISREDAQAEAWLKDLVAGPRETWMANLLAHPEYRTAGMVRKLVAATERAIDTMPPDALAMTELATAIADHLPATAYVTDTVAKLRGTAWRERAYALFYVGSYTEAEAAIGTSEKHFSDCVVSDYDLGRDHIVHALVHRALDHDSDTVAISADAVKRLQPFEDVQRYVSAVMVQAQARMKVMDYAGALDLLSGARDRYLDCLSADTNARVLANIGLCQRSLRHFADAIETYRMASILFDDLGIQTEVVRTRANLAVVLRDAGRVEDARSETYAVRGMFERLGMASEVAVASLVLADIALISGDYSEVEALCRDAMRYLESAGVPYGPRAMTALAFVSEAARHRRVTPKVVDHVQSYIRRLPAQPTLLFALPPE